MQRTPHGPAARKPPANGLPTVGLAPSRIDPTARQPLYRQIYAALRSDILEGALRAGQRLQASRTLAHTLQVSRNTVQEAIDLLTAEGYVEGRVGAGTFVCDVLPESLLQTKSPRTSPPGTGPTPPLPARALAAIDAARAQRERRVLPFQPGIPDLEAFPWDTWHRCAQQAQKQVRPSEGGYGDPAGHLPLRQALADHLRAIRGIDCRAEHILIVSGSQQGLSLAARTLLEPDAPVWVEDPGYLGCRAAMQAEGARPVAVPVDEQGLMVEVGRTRAADARLVCVTPSHQYPLGTTMSLARRLALLSWAHQAGAWILEDDYDSEYRYAGRPLAPLKSLDRDQRVIYLGTFSKVLFPALRLGYLVVPPALCDAFAAGRWAMDRQPSLHDQATLTMFLTSGGFERHIRRMLRRYRRRQEALHEHASKLLGDRLRIRSHDTGMHVVGWLPPGTDDDAAARRAATVDVRTVALSDYGLQEKRAPGWVLGYAAYPCAAIREAIERLDRVLS